jgi:hypothetical protein
MVGLLTLRYIVLTPFIPMYFTSVKSFYSQNDRQTHENPKTIECDVWYDWCVLCERFTDDTAM